MREKAAILDLAEPVWGNETPGNGSGGCGNTGWCRSGGDRHHGGHRCGERADQIESALARVCALCVQAIRVLEDPCRDRWIRGRAQVVRSRLEFLLCGAGDHAFCPVFEPQQSTEEERSRRSQARLKHRTSMHSRLWGSRHDASWGYTTQKWSLTPGTSSAARSCATSIPIMYRGMSGILRESSRGVPRSAARLRGFDELEGR